MAYIKTIPIRYHVKTAIDYIAHPNKTDDGRLVDTFHCTLPIADIEFKDTREYARDNGLNALTHAARHIIQSFKPGEVTPDEAMQIGKEFVEKILGGKYEYVIATHVDTQAIHNHIIFNSVSFKDFHAEKSNKRTYNRWRAVNDELCEAHGLSVIQKSKKAKKHNNRDLYENRTSKRVIWRDILRSDIDKTITEVDSFEEFLRHMSELGYSIKRGKNIAFKHYAQERYIRLRSLKRDYSEHDIQERIITKRPAIPKRFRDGKHDISLLLNMETSIKCQTSPGYRHWATLHNLQEAAKTLNYLIENNITTLEDLSEKISSARSEKLSAIDRIKNIENELKTNREACALLQSYHETKPIAIEYDKSKFKAKFKQKHFDELRLFEASQQRLTELYPNKKIPSPSVLESREKRLETEKDNLYDAYKAATEQEQRYSVMLRNIELFMGNAHTEPTRNHHKDKSNELV